MLDDSVPPEVLHPCHFYSRCTRNLLKLRVAESVKIASMPYLDIWFGS
jgi:hypothetical protein